MPPAPQNPYRQFRGSRTWDEVAAQLGADVNYMRKLGCGSVTGISPQLAKQFEIRSGGLLAFEALMRWALEPPRRKAKRRKRRANGRAAA